MEHFTGRQGGKDPLGSVMNAQTHRINIAMTAEPQTLQQISDRCGVDNLNRLYHHMRWLVKNDYAERHGPDSWSLNRRGLRMLDGHLLSNSDGSHKSRQFPDDSQHLNTSLISATDESFAEGREFLRLHRLRERNVTLVRRKKEQVFASTGKLACEVCDFDFAAVYGPIGVGFAECHHTHPLAEVCTERRTKLSEMAVVCPNCHRMLHRPPFQSVTQLREVVHARRTDFNP